MPWRLKVYLAATASHLSHYGYWGVALVVALESVGVPLPGETALVAAAAYAGQSHKLDPWLIFLAGSMAAIAGNVVGYFIGLKGGYPLARRYGPKVRLDEHKLKVGRYVLDTQGWKVVVVGRFISVLRAYIAFLAGTLEMRRRSFFVASVFAAVAWAGLYTAVAYNAASTSSGLSIWVEVGIGCAVVIVAVAGYFVLRKQVKKLGDKAEAAYPGPLI